MGGKSQMGGQPMQQYQTQGQPFQQNPIGGYRPSGFTQWQQGHNLGLVGGNQFNRNLPYQQEYNTGNYSGYGRTPQWSNSRWNRGMDTFQTGTWRPPVEGETVDGGAWGSATQNPADSTADGLSNQFGGADVYSGAMGGQQPPANDGMWAKRQAKQAAFMRAFQPPKEQEASPTGTDSAGTNYSDLLQQQFNWGGFPQNPNMNYFDRVRRQNPGGVFGGIANMPQKDMTQTDWQQEAPILRRAEPSFQNSQMYGQLMQRLQGYGG